MTEGNMSDMMAKLAAAEAEAEKLRSELKESARSPDLDELANRIDPLPSSSSSQMQPHRINEFLTKLFKVKARVHQNPT